MVTRKKIQEQAKQEAIEKLRGWIEKDQEIFGQLISTNGMEIYRITFLAPIVDNVTGKPTILPLDSYISDILGYRITKPEKQAKALLLNETGTIAIANLSRELFGEAWLLKYRYLY